MSDLKSMLRRGEISGRQAEKLGIFKKPKAPAAKVVDVDKDGDKDGARGKGAPEASAKHVDKTKGGSK